MQNVNMVVKGNRLLVEVDATQSLYNSESGKSTVVATTGGNVQVPNMPEIKIGLNVFKPVKASAGVVRETKNVKMSMTKTNKLTIEVDLTQEFGPSGSGKSIVIASSGGNTAVAEMPELRVGLNVYKPLKPGKPTQPVQPTLI